MIDSKILKAIYPDIIKPLLYILNLSLDQGVVPVELKIAKITPFYKEDAPAVFNNYRPISVLPALSKVLEKLVYTRLIQHLDKNNIHIICTPVWF